MPEVEVWQVKSFSGSNGHADLISEEGVVDEVGRVAVAHHHYDSSDDFSDLVVDEALPDDVEAEEVPVHHPDCELYYVSLGLGVLCF